MRDKIIWRQIQIRSSETLLELSLTWLESRWKEAAVDNSLDTAQCSRNFWTNLCCNRRTVTSEAKKERWNHKKNSSSFHHRNCKNGKKFGKNRFLCLPTFFMKLLFCCFAVVCCRCKWQERKTHLNPLFSFFYDYQGLRKVSPLAEQGDDVMRENISGWNEEPTKVSFAIEMENVKSF